MSPLPGTRMIPTGWSRHHQGIVLGSMNATALIIDPTRTTPGAWDDTTGTYGAPTEHIVAGGPTDPREDWHAGIPLRLQQLESGSGEIDQAEQKIGTHRYLAQFPADLPHLQLGWTVRIIDVINDAHLARTLGTIAADTVISAGTILDSKDRPGVELTVVDELHGSEMFTRDVILEHNQQPQADR